MLGAERFVSQFAFLQGDFKDLYDHARKAEALALADPRAACFYARLALELGVKWIYAHDSSLKAPYQDTLSALIHDPAFGKLVGHLLVTKAKIIKDIGNLAVHETRALPADKAVVALRELFHFSYWLVRTYGKVTRPAPGLTFSADALPKTALIETQRLGKLKEIEQQHRAAEQARAAAEQEKLRSDSERARLEAELAALQAEVARIKAANQAQPDAHDYDEAKTRDAFIDLLLNEAGWPLDQKRDTEFPVTGMPNNTGDGFVDYMLWGDDGKPLGLVEAKRTRRDARVGQRQAELYADALERQFGQRPIIFYSNGYDHWIWDDRRYPPREIQGFLKKPELELAIQRRDSLRPLAQQAIDSAIVERYYQSRAIRKVAEVFETDHQRKALLVMATGSGKTRTVIALSDLLMRANWAKRILFLADRVALVKQAANAFKKFMPHSAPVNLADSGTNPADYSTGRVHISTYPTMMNLIDEMTAGGQRLFGSGHYDLIVVDEAHRSIYRRYKAIFEYFDCLLLGLTATPRAEIDRDTYGLFGLERGVPTDAYDLDEAVRDKYLVPPRAVSVPLKFMRQGIRYDELSDEEKVAWDEIDWDEDGNVPDEVEAARLNTWLFNADTVDRMLEHLMTQGLKVAEGDRLAKTIIFARNHEHALFISKRFDENYPHLKGQFARVVDFKTDYVQTLIDDFSVAEKAPHIAISVDMLDTGIDVPEVCNLVFFKPVRSKTKFWQMIGRGTRLCPDLFGPGRDKQFFYVFDYCQNFEYFRENPEAANLGPVRSLSERLFALRTDLIAESDRVIGVSSGDPMRDWRHGLADELRNTVAEMELENFIVRPKRKLVEKYRTEEAWDRIDLDARTELIEEVAGLPSARNDPDLVAKQFDLLILQTELAVLKHERRLDALRKQVIELAEALEGLTNIPQVAAELALIQDIQTTGYWQGVTPPILEEARRRLRGLIGLIDKKKSKRIYSDFQDQLGEAVEVEMPGLRGGGDLTRFRDKARFLLKRHLDHIAVQKARRNEPLTTQDLDELDRLFREAGLEEFESVKQAGDLAGFIRSLVGLDREAAKQAFAGFMAQRALSARQIDFLNLIIDYLTESGSMEPGLLYESPFTNMDSAGVAGLFPTADVVELIGILRKVGKTAA